MIEHEQADIERFNATDASLNEIKLMLIPVADVFRTVARLGKWSKASLGALLLLLSIIIALKTLFSR